jgi:hypothetical protein
MRRFRRSVVLIAVGFAAGLAPAAAQFGGIFGDPPRPPGNVPSRPPVDDRFIDQRGVPPPYPQYPPPAQAYPPPPAQTYQPAPPQYQPPPQDAPATTAATTPGGIQSQALPPVPGVPVAPAAAPAAPLPGAPPNPALGAGPPAGAPPTTDTTVQPGDEVVITPPAQKIVNPTAVFRGLDKITGRITSFDVAINETVQFGALQVTPRACYTRPPTEPANTDAFVEVAEVTLQGEVKRIFTGWMFAASPGLHAVEHPIYDVWLTDCKGGAPPAPVAQAQPAAPARPAPRTPARPVRPSR